MSWHACAELSKIRDGDDDDVDVVVDVGGACLAGSQRASTLPLPTPPSV